MGFNHFRTRWLLFLGLNGFYSFVDEIVVMF